MVVAGVLARLVRPLQAPWIPYLPGVILLLVGLGIALLMGEPTWFSRFGAVLVIVALLTALGSIRLQQEFSEFRERLLSYQLQICRDDTALTVVNEGESYYRLEFPRFVFWGLVKSGEIGARQVKGVRVAFPKDDRMMMLIEVPVRELHTFSTEIQTATKAELDSLIRAELIYAAVGTLVGAFGDLLIL